MGKKIPLWQAYVVFLVTIIVLMYCLGILGKLLGDAFACDYGEVHIALLTSATFAAIVAAANGYKWSFLEAGMLASINRSMQAMLNLAEVGLMIGAWVAAGVVPAMIYYGLLILKPSIFLFAACLLCCIVALATGSSWTTAGTIGVALIGVATGLGIPTGMAAGAVVSGAYFGDKMSPLSDTTNLAPAMAGATLFDHISHMVYTVTPSLLIALILYLILGFKNSNGSGTMDIVEPMRAACQINFNINLFMLIPPILVILIVALKIPAIPGLTAGIIAGLIIGSIFNGVSLAEWPGIMHYGYEVPSYTDTFTNWETTNADAIASINPDAGGLMDLSNDEFAALQAATTVPSEIVGEYNVEQLLDGRGGMDGMMWTINLILCAMCFGGIMDASGMLGAIAQSFLKVARGRGGLVTATVFSCILMNVIAGDQYLSIVLPGRMYKTTYEDMKLAPRNLSRCLEDSGTITSSLIPWNTCGATMQKFLGVPTWGKGGYGYFAFLNLINPLVSIFYGFTGITMMKMTDEEYEHILKEREREKEEALGELDA